MIYKYIKNSRMMISKETLDLISQIGIAVFGIIAIILVAQKNKWGFVFGLISQPFWLISSYINKQWGIFIISIVYAGTWAYGVYKWFYTDEKRDLRSKFNQKNLRKTKKQFHKQ